MKRLLILLALLVLALGGPARGEDGIDPSPKPVACFQVDLDSGENYTSPVPERNECIDGGSGSNEIHALGGVDWVNAKGGSDPIYLGDLGDVGYGGNEGDAIHGEDGPDHLYAGCPNGCDGGQGGGQFVNVLYGEAGNDYLAMRNNVGGDIAHCGNGGSDVAYLDSKSVTDFGGLFDTADASCEDVRRG